MAGLSPAKHGELEPSAIQAELARIVASQTFARSGRLSRFLQFVVAAAMEGRTEDLKEYSIALEVFDRPASYDPQIDSLVRVEASRLRARLKEYYASEGQNDLIRIDIPKGSYAPVFGERSAPVTEHPASGWRRRSIIPAAAVAVIAIGWLASGLRTAPPAEIRPLAASPGSMGAPSLSPDGTRVAFFWSGPPDQPDPGIYVKSVDREDRRRIALGNGDPAWSPDGSEIAFSRGESGGVFLVSQLGGSERKVADSGTDVAWTPDGTALLLRHEELASAAPWSAIYSVSLKTLEKRRLTQSFLPIRDWKSAVSPDGQTLAFIRTGLPGLADIYLVPMSGGEPRRLTDWNTEMGGLAWTPDGQEIVYAVTEPAGPRLWRIRARAAEPGRGVRLAASTGDAQHPAISSGGTSGVWRLAYTSSRLEISLRLIDLTKRDTSGVLIGSTLFQRSSRQEYGGRVSPDGKLAAFLSNRDGAAEIWISGLDGSNLHRLTSSNGEPAVPAWSPDGNALTFIRATGRGGLKPIFIVNVSGGEPKQLTPAMELVGWGNWSHDGKWIYFGSNRSGTLQIWKMDPNGDNSVQITRNGGLEAQESPDGKYLYYTEKRPKEFSGLKFPVRLMRVPVSGGEEIPVIPEVRTLHWSVTDKGIYHYFPGPPCRSIKLYRFDTGATEHAGDLPEQTAPIEGGLSVSRDGRWLFMSHVERDSADLMVMHHFR
jgi:Tol biopolymer transport system component